jgi:hypothetical protein
VEEFKTDLEPGDPAPGGGIVGDVGDSAERFIKAIIGRQERGAIITGRRVRKVNSEEGDRTPNGREGKVLGSIAQPNLEPLIVDERVAIYGYFVLWDGDKVPVFTTNMKVEEL